MLARVSKKCTVIDIRLYKIQEHNSASEVSEWYKCFVCNIMAEAVKRLSFQF